MDLARRMVQCGSITTRTLDRIYNSSVTLVQIASRRWRPQPILRRRLCTKTAGTNSSAQGFELVFLESGEQVANDALFEASMKKSSVPWKDYSRLMKDEKSIYMAHLNAYLSTCTKGVAAVTVVDIVPTALRTVPISLKRSSSGMELTMFNHRI
ncbi:hypothetical protein Q1695_012253 [Nippostrongylus brasiliensis]|nr:hypothetical protein Q1695_012253 [Nippostrongylus brasiliensis]